VLEERRVLRAVIKPLRRHGLFVESTFKAPLNTLPCAERAVLMHRLVR
jgi:hypothetical protein